MLGLRKAAPTAGGPGGPEGFSIANEDFPALPGTVGQRASEDARNGFNLQPAGPGGRGGFPLLSPATGDQYSVPGAQAATAADYEQLLLRYQQGRAGAGQGGAGSMPGALMMGKGGMAGGPSGLLGGPGPAGADGGVVKLVGGAPTSSQSAQITMPHDRFGLLGLMPLLKMSDPDLTMLALGTDLTSLGLNLNSSVNLHRCLISPLLDNPVKPEPEYELPSCYKHTPQRLQPGYLTKFKEETLFYIFYRFVCVCACVCGGGAEAEVGAVFKRAGLYRDRVGVCISAHIAPTVPCVLCVLIPVPSLPAAHMHARAHAHMQTRMRVHIHDTLHMRVHMHVLYMYTCVYVCTCVYTYNLHVCAHVHTHAHHFYTRSMPADEAQLIAADELSARGWIFHKRLRMWMLHAPNTVPQKTARGERGSFLAFNPSGV